MLLQRLRLDFTRWAVCQINQFLGWVKWDRHRSTLILPRLVLGPFPSVWVFSGNSLANGSEMLENDSDCTLLQPHAWQISTERSVPTNIFSIDCTIGVSLRWFWLIWGSYPGMIFLFSWADFWYTIAWAANLSMKTLKNSCESCWPCPATCFKCLFLKHSIRNLDGVIGLPRLCDSSSFASADDAHDLCTKSSYMVYNMPGSSNNICTI